MRPTASHATVKRRTSPGFTSLFGRLYEVRKGAFDRALDQAFQRAHAGAKTEAPYELLKRLDRMTSDYNDL